MYVSCLDRFGFQFTFYDGKINLMLNSQVVGNDILLDGLYKFSLDCDNISSSLNVESSIAKRFKIREKSFLLWNQCLGQEIVERLIREDILSFLDFNDLETCVDCIRGNFTKTNKKSLTRRLDLLEIIHIDINDPLSPTIYGNKYFIASFDDFSRFGYIHFIKEKSEALEKIKIFKTEVEKQLEKVMQVVCSDRGGEYYGRYDSTRKLYTCVFDAMRFGVQNGSFDK